VELDEIKRRCASGDVRLSDALARALPKFRGLVADDVLIWCSSELQGYSNALEFYQRGDHQLPLDRVVEGQLRVVHADGTFGDIEHQLAQRSEYFLSAPLAWLEDFYSLPGEYTVVDLPELTTYIGRQSGGTIICQCSKAELERIICNFRTQFITVIDGVLSAKQAKDASRYQQPPQWLPTEPSAVDNGFPSAPEAPAWTPDATAEDATASSSTNNPVPAWNQAPFSEFSNLKHPGSSNQTTIQIGGAQTQATPAQSSSSKFFSPGTPKAKSDQPEVSRLRNMQQSVAEIDPKVKKQQQLAEKRAAEAAAASGVTEVRPDAAPVGSLLDIQFPAPPPPQPNQQKSIPAPPAPFPAPSPLDQQASFPAPPAPGQQGYFPAPERQGYFPAPAQQGSVSTASGLEQQGSVPTTSGLEQQESFPAPPAPNQPLPIPAPPTPDQSFVLPAPPLPSNQAANSSTSAVGLNRLSQLVPKPVPKPAPENNPLSPFAPKSEEQKAEELASALDKAFEKIVEPDEAPVTPQWPKPEPATMRDVPGQKPNLFDRVENANAKAEAEARGTTIDPWKGGEDEHQPQLASKMSFESGIQLTIEAPPKEEGSKKRVYDPLSELMADAQLQTAQARAAGATGSVSPAPNVVAQEQAAEPKPTVHPPAPSAGQQQGSLGPNLFEDMLKHLGTSGSHKKVQSDTVPDDTEGQSPQQDGPSQKDSQGLLADMMKVSQAGASALLGLQNAKAAPADGDHSQGGMPPGSSPFKAAGTGPNSPGQYTPPSPNSSSTTSPFVGGSQSPDMPGSGSGPMMSSAGGITASGTFATLAAVPFAAPLNEVPAPPPPPSAVSGSTVPKPANVPFMRTSKPAAPGQNPAPASGPSEPAMKQAMLFADMLKLSQFAPQLLSKGGAQSPATSGETAQAEAPRPQGFASEESASAESASEGSAAEGNASQSEPSEALVSEAPAFETAASESVGTPAVNSEVAGAETAPTSGAITEEVSKSASTPAVRTQPVSQFGESFKSGIDWKTIGKSLTEGVSAEPTNITKVIPNTVKNKALQLMTKAYGSRDLLISCKDLESADPVQRELLESVLSYMYKKNWIRPGTDPQTYTLTKEGVQEVEQSLAF